MGESTLGVGEYREEDEEEDEEGGKETPEDPCVNPWAVGEWEYRGS